MRVGSSPYDVSYSPRLARTFKVSLAYAARFAASRGAGSLLLLLPVATIRPPLRPATERPRPGQNGMDTEVETRGPGRRGSLRLFAVPGNHRKDALEHGLEARLDLR